MWIICENGDAVNLTMISELQAFGGEIRAYYGRADYVTVQKCNSIDEAQDMIYDILSLQANGSKLLNICPAVAARNMELED